MTNPRAWERPDGSLVVRRGSRVVSIPDDIVVTDAVPMHPVPDVTEDDLRVAILDEALGFALDNDGERTPSARLLLARLDAAARASK